MRVYFCYGERKKNTPMQVADHGYWGSVAEAKGSVGRGTKEQGEAVLQITGNEIEIGSVSHSHTSRA